MSREDEVRRALRESRSGKKKPATKMYVAIFLVLAAVLSVYLLLNFMSAKPLPAEPVTGAAASHDVLSDAEARQTSDYIDSSAQESLQDVDSMGAFLGI